MGTGAAEAEAGAQPQAQELNGQKLEEAGTLLPGVSEGTRPRGGHPRRRPAACERICVHFYRSSPCSRSFVVAASPTSVPARNPPARILEETEHVPRQSRQRLSFLFHVISLSGGDLQFKSRWSGRAGQGCHRFCGAAKGGGSRFSGDTALLSRRFLSQRPDPRAPGRAPGAARQAPSTFRERVWPSWKHRPRVAQSDARSRLPTSVRQGNRTSGRLSVDGSLSRGSSPPGISERAHPSSWSASQKEAQIIVLAREWLCRPA